MSRAFCWTQALTLTNANVHVNVRWLKATPTRYPLLKAQIDAGIFEEMSSGTH